MHKFTVSTTNSHTREEPNQAAHNQYQAASDPNQQKVPPRVHSGWFQRSQEQSKPVDPNIPRIVEDVFAANIKSQQDQFADLHNRLQIINHKLDGIYDMIENLVSENDGKFNQLMGRVVPMHDQISATMRNVEKVERTTMETLRDLESKDFKDLLNQVHASIDRNHNSLANNLPLAMANSKST